MYPLKIVGDCPLEETGSKVTFSPDGSIFEDTVYDYDVLRQRLREMAFLTKNLRIILTDKRPVRSARKPSITRVVSKSSWSI